MTRKDDSGLMIKLSMVRRGCNGMSYQIKYTKDKNKLDELYEEEGYLKRN